MTASIETGDTVCFSNLIRRSREYIVVRVDDDKACLRSYCPQHVTLTNIPLSDLVRRFNRTHRTINFIKRKLSK